MNCLQVYHPALRNDGVDRDVCIHELVLKARECGKIGPVDLSSPPLCLLVVTTVFTEGGLGVNGNLLN